jgi:hypothetical protein
MDTIDVENVGPKNIKDEDGRGVYRICAKHSSKYSTRR